MCKRSLGETPSGSKYRFNPDEDKGKVGLGRKSIILQLIFEKVSARLQGVLDAKFPFKGISYLAGMAMAWYPCCSVIGWEQPKGSMTRGEPPRGPEGTAPGGSESVMFSTAGSLERKCEVGNSMTATVTLVTMGQVHSYYFI